MAEEDKWVINKGGIVNSIPGDMLMPPGVRLATEEEVAEFLRADAIVAAKNLAAAEEAAAKAAQLVVIGNPLGADGTAIKKGKG